MDGASTDGAPVTLAVVRLTATNVSDRETGEIIQLYVSRPSSAIERPVHELRGFARVELSPGESREVAIELTERAFRHYDRDRSAWAIEGGDAVITVGRHSRDRVLEATLHLEDRVLAAAPADPAAPPAPSPRRPSGRSPRRDPSPVMPPSRSAASSARTTRCATSSTPAARSVAAPTAS